MRTLIDRRVVLEQQLDGALKRASDLQRQLTENEVAINKIKNEAAINKIKSSLCWIVPNQKDFYWIKNQLEITENVFVQDRDSDFDCHKNTIYGFVILPPDESAIAIEIGRIFDRVFGRMFILNLNERDNMNIDTVCLRSDLEEEEFVSVPIYEATYDVLNDFSREIRNRVELIKTIKETIYEFEKM